MLFEASRELPRAEVVREPATFTELVTSGIAQWVRDRMRWMRPRMIPLVVAMIGLGVTVEAVKALARPPAQVESSIGAAPSSTYNPHRIRVVMQQ